MIEAYRDSDQVDNTNHKCCADNITGSWNFWCGGYFDNFHFISFAEIVIDAYLIYA